MGARTVKMCLLSSDRLTAMQYEPQSLGRSKWDVRMQSLTSHAGHGESQCQTYKRK
jgi:hypothetical protein